MRSLAVIACVLLAFVSASSPALSSPAALPSGNLLQNPGAESGPGSASGNDYLKIPGWTTTPNFTAVNYGASGFPDTSVSAKIGGGTNFFAGGQDTAQSVATQEVDVSDASAEIDAGQAQAFLSAFIGGFSSQDDNGVVEAIFLNSAGRQLGGLQIGPVTAADRSDQTTLLPRSTTGVVPTGTRTVRVNMRATRLEGSYDDGYFDNLDLELRSSTAPTTPPPPSQPGTFSTVTGGTVLVNGMTQAPGQLVTVASGAVVDVSRGWMGLTATDGSTATFSGTESNLSQGVVTQAKAVSAFKITQPTSPAAVTTLTLAGGNFSACSGRALASAGKKKKKPVRLLWGKGKGHFRSAGRDSTASVHGTEWLTEDRCDGTLTVVKTGVVRIRDLRKHKTVTVKAGHSYLALHRP